jgi:hypothetical protein
MGRRGEPSVVTEAPPGTARTFLFLLRQVPDIDHISPMIWKCLEKGDRALVLFERLPYDDDYRIRFLRGYPRFQILTLPRPAYPGRLPAIAERRRYTARRLRELLSAHRVAACFFDWGGGITVSRTSLAGRVRRFARARWYWPRYEDVHNLVVHRVLDALFPPLRAGLARAAYDAGLPTFALPHGLHVFQDADITAYRAERARRGGGAIVQTDRNSFTVYVVNTEHYRQMRIRAFGGDPDVVQSWGSLRFSPEWRRVLAGIVPAASLPARGPGQLRALFLVPKWQTFVNKPETLKMIRSVAERPDVQLLIQTHPRKGRAELDATTIAALERRPNVVLAQDADSKALIDAADFAIVLSSSLVIELFLQRKPIIYAKYLHPHRMLYEGHPGCLTARNLSEVHEWGDRIARGAAPSIDDSAVAAAAREFVYGGQEPFDVPEYYYARVQSYLTPAARGTQDSSIDAAVARIRAMR